MNRGTDLDITRRERDVLIALCRPAASSEVFVEPASVHAIAQELVVTDAAVKQHLRHLYDKFGIPESEPRRRLALARDALRREAISLPELQKAIKRATETGDPVGAAREAFVRRDWDAVCALLAEVDRAELSADDLERLAEAGHWSNRHEQSFAAGQRAYHAHVAAGDTPRAAHMALMLTIHYANRMDFAVANGWLAKADRLLQDTSECFAHGLRQIVGALFSEAGGDWPAVMANGQLAREIGRRCKDADLQQLGLAFEGIALVHQGQVPEGTRLLDEAMASAVAGELTTMATGVIYCRMLCASLDLHDFGRASEWTEVIDRCAANPGMGGGFSGDCRTHRAEVMLWRGSWADGEQEALRALEETERFSLAHVGIAARALGDIRLRNGDTEGAALAYRHAHEYGIAPEPGMSLLRLARGDPAGATHQLQTALQALGDDRLARMRLLPATIEAALSTRDLATARTALAELEETAETFHQPAITAAAEHARGEVELANGHPDEAVSRLRSAHRLWQALDAPYDATLARTLLADAHLACGDHDAALLELQAASTTFERLGARIECERVTQKIAALDP